MGFLDKLKGLFRGRTEQVKDAIDRGADAVTDRVGEEHADKVDDAADKAKDAVDKLD